MNKQILQENFDSKNLFNKIILLSESQIFGISNGIDWVKNNLPDAVLVGGTAVVHYLNGGRDLTPDIDFLVGDIESVKEKLEDDHVLFYPLKDGGKTLGISSEEFNTDFLDVNVGNRIIKKLILKTFKYVKINGQTIKIVCPELLAIMKLELGRSKDLDDGIALLRSGKVNKDHYINFVKNLKNNLSDYDSILGYSELIK